MRDGRVEEANALAVSTTNRKGTQAVENRVTDLHFCCW